MLHSVLTPCIAMLSPCILLSDCLSDVPRSLSLGSSHSARVASAEPIAWQHLNKGLSIPRALPDLRLANTRQTPSEPLCSALYCHLTRLGLVSV